MPILTISLKLHKPSNIKRQVLDEALECYNRAFIFLLDKAAHELEDIKSRYGDRYGRFRAVRLAGWVGGAEAGELGRFGIEPFRDSLKLDFGMALAAYLNTEEKNKKVGYPLSEKAASRENGSNRPIYFCRYSMNRDFCLLYDKEHQKYYAKLYLMNSKSQNRRVPQVSGKRELHYIYKEYKGLEQGGRKVRYLLFPLSFGRRQEEIIRAGLVNPGIFKTARLSKKGSDYFLAINIATEEPEKIETGSFMGVARGLSSPMNYTITDLTGNACGNGSINLPGTSGYTRNSLRIGDLHRIANEITAKALEYKACVIAEKLVDKGDRLQWADGSGKEFFPVLGCSDYNRILRLLQYKLPAKGLPIPVRVSPSRIFSSCPVCGENSKQNRFNRDLFICTACGNTEHMEGLGSLNLSRRLLQNSSIPVIIRAERTSCGIRFTNKELGLECSIPLQKDLPQAMSEELDKLIRDFFSSLGSESKGSGFNKKYSLIKKLQQCKDKMQLIKLIG